MNSLNCVSLPGRPFVTNRYCAYSGKVFGHGRSEVAQYRYHVRKGPGSGSPGLVLLDEIPTRCPRLCVAAPLPGFQDEAAVVHFLPIQRAGQADFRRPNRDGEGSGREIR